MTPPAFDPELAAVSVAQTSLSKLDAETGELRIGGYPVDELAANATYEETVFLLFEGRLPTDEELTAFRADLADRRALAPAVRDLLVRAGETDVSPMDALRIGVAAAGMGVGGDADKDVTDPEEQARRVVAVAPTVVATYWRARRGETPVEPRADLGHAANYLYMLTGEEPDEAAVDGLETFLTTAVDHGLNTSTFAARTTVSTDSDLFSGVTAAVGALKGPRHGDFAGLYDLLVDLRTAEDVDSTVRDLAAGEERLPGFGHPLYRVRDPRIAVLSVAAEDVADDDALVETVRAYEEAAVDALAEQRRRARPNMELYATALLDAVGIPRALFTPTFAVSRVGGWAAHCLEQLADGTLIRPHSQYVGRTSDTWPPVEQRYAVGDAVLQRPPGSGTLEPISETLATLSEPSRLEILLALYDSEGVAYSTLRDATSISDKGRFNYHLRQLRDYFVADGEDGYALTEAGRTVVETVVTDDRFYRAEEN